MKVGIDPGNTGAIAFVDGDMTCLHDMPTTAKATGNGVEVNPALVAQILRRIEPGDTVYLEAVHSMPSQGVSSTFTFGRGFGVVEGVLAALGIPYNLVRPRAWKKRAGLIGKEKDAARGLAIRLYPGSAARLARKKDIGRADALMIAHFGEG